MGIGLIDNQPWRFEVRNEYQACKKTGDNCILLADGDDVFIEFQNTPCGSPLLCDSDFTGASLGNLVENGSFAIDASGWTFGVNWSFTTPGQLDLNGVGGLSQTIAAGLIAGNCYVLTFTITNYVAGTLRPLLGVATAGDITADGEYRQVIVCGAGTDLLFQPQVASQLSIGNIQLFDMGFCWCPDNGNLYSTSGAGAMCHVPGVDTILTQVGVIPPILNGALYKVQVTITARSAGSVHFIVGTAAVSIDFIGNGTFTDYVLSDGINNFEIFFSSDFDGCIDNVDVYFMNTDHQFGIVETDGVTSVQALVGYATFVEGYIILSFDTTVFLFTHGCYLITSLDSCDSTVRNSQCFSWQVTHAGTRQIIATDWVSPDPIPRYSFGFLWYSILFYLVQRVKLNFRKPSKLSKSVSDRYSTGIYYKSYVEQSKRWELLIETLDETQHDSMAVMTQCKSWSIDGVDYFSHEDEYTPDWDEKGYEIVSDVKLTVSRKQDVIFADNCNR